MASDTKGKDFLNLSLSSVTMKQYHIIPTLLPCQTLRGSISEDSVNSHIAKAQHCKDSSNRASTVTDAQINRRNNLT